MALWKWITERLYVTHGLEKWRTIFHRDSETNEDTTATGAMKLSTWWSASRLITETVATLPSGFFQAIGEDRVALPDYPLNILLRHQPNDFQSPVEFWEGRVGPVCVHGNSFAEKRMIGNRIVSLLPMPFDQVTLIRRPIDNQLIYKFTDRGKTVEMPPEKVFHIKGFVPNDEDLGLSPIEFASRSLGGALSVERAAARVYSRGLRAQGFFSPPSTMDRTQREDFIKNYILPGEGAQGEGKTLIFPPGFEWKSMNITPRDAEMLMTRGFNVEDVCRWMRVPPILVGHAATGQTMFGSGVEQIILGWLVLGLRAYLKKIEAAVNFRLVPLADRLNGIYFEFNFEGLLRADSAARASLMATLAQNGLRTRNELRRIDHYPGVKDEGADSLTVQSNLVPIEKLGQQPETPQQKQINDQQTVAENVKQSIIQWLKLEGHVK